MAADPFDGHYAQCVEVYGCDGSYWYISGPDLPVEAGVSLNPRIKGGIDAPVKTLWSPGAFGEEHQGYRWQRRDMVFSVQTFAQDHETWMTVDAEWRNAFDYVKESTVVFTTSAGSRYLKVRLLEEPTSYEGDTDRGKSPFLVCDSTVVMTVAAELPFYFAEPAVYEWELGAGDIVSDWVNFTIDISNDSDVPVWPRWTLSGGATWVLPDFSWGSTEYSRPLQDAGRVVELPPLAPEEGVVVDSDPRRQTILAANMAPVQARWRGQDLLYPIAPGAAGSVPVSAHDIVPGMGLSLRLEIPRWFTRPWGRRLP